MKKRIAYLLALSLCLSFAVPAFGAKAPAKEFRGIWVSTVYNLDYPAKATTSADSLKAQADQILDNCRAMGMTAVILQVRPSADALYPSEIYPWSVYLTGDQDAAPGGGFDPLRYWIDGAHERGLELHAWINPYRVTKKGDAEYASLSVKNPAKQHPEWLVKHTDGNYYFDPGVPEVRDLVVRGVQEILDRYDVDGIHLDDYFYPAADFADSASFKRYGGGFESVGDWRRDNVNALVRELGEAVRGVERGISYGISPAGIWANKSSLPGGSETLGGETYFSHFADSKKWVEEGYIDYICPQIYWNIGYDKADYEILARWWSDVVDGTGVKLYIGMADYKAGNTGGGSPWQGVSELSRQLKLNASLPNVAGEVHFRYGTMLGVQGLTDLYAGYYQ